MGYLDEYKVTQGEIATNHVQAAPTVLNGTASQNKKVFDNEEITKVEKYMKEHYQLSVDSLLKDSVHLV